MGLRRWLLFALLPVLAVAQADEVAPIAAISLIIDDLGNDLYLGDQVVNLPAPVTCAFLPYGAHTQALARAAHHADKEVMLHLPMQSVHERALDPGALTLDMSETTVSETIDRDLAAVPYVSGVNNHMGSLLTRHPGHMAWLMTAMQGHGHLFFVDSRTTKRSIARRLAREYGLPNLQRDVFLDVKREPDSIREQFLALIDRARLRGTALGIGHPYPETLSVLRAELEQLDDYDINLVPVSRLIELRNERRRSWRASLSP